MERHAPDGRRFQAGRNTESYRYYIGFPARYGIPTSSWTRLVGFGDDVFPSQSISICGELIAYDQERNVQESYFGG